MRLSIKKQTKLVLNEFQEISSDLEKSIYLLAFNKYEGFGDF
jgi:hypothetical protein